MYCRRTLLWIWRLVFCVPLFASGWLLGHMMVIDAHQSLTSEERTRIELAGAEIAAQLYADRLETDPGHLERQRKTQALLSEHERTRLAALAFFAKEANLANAQHVVVTIVQVTVSDSTKPSIGIALHLALETANRTHSRRSLHLVEVNRALLLLQADSSEIIVTSCRIRPDRIVVELSRSFGRHCRVDVGIGADNGGLNTAWLARRLLDLDDGGNRLELHIGLHLLRLVLPCSISDR